jgi:hypothetical protein
MINSSLSKKSLFAFVLLTLLVSSCTGSHNSCGCSEKKNFKKFKKKQNHYVSQSNSYNEYANNRFCIDIQTADF